MTLDEIHRLISEYETAESARRESNRIRLLAKIQSLGITDAVPIGNQDEEPRFRWNCIEFVYVDDEGNCGGQFCCVWCDKSVMNFPMLEIDEVKNRIDLGRELSGFKRVAPTCSGCGKSPI